MEYGQQGQHGHGTTGRIDQYGNPVGGVGHGTGTGTGGMGYGGTTGTGGMGQLGEHGGAGMGGGQFQPAREEHKTGGVLHRSGSSSSSSVTNHLHPSFFVFSAPAPSLIGSIGPTY